MTPYLKQNKELKIHHHKMINSINTGIRILFAIIFNVDDHNKGQKKKLLNFLQTLVGQNDARRLTHNFYIEEIIKTIANNMEENPQAQYIHPPQHLYNLSLAQKLYSLMELYGGDFFRLNSEKLLPLEHVTINVLKILLGPGEFNLKIRQFEDLRKDSLNFAYGCMYINIIEKMLLPHKKVSEVFQNSGAGKASGALSGIVMEYYEGHVRTLPVILPQTQLYSFFAPQAKKMLRSIPQENIEFRLK